MKKILLLILLVVGGCANGTKQPKLSTILDRARYIRQQGYSKDETYTRTLSVFNEIYGYEHEKEAVKLFKKLASEKVDLSTPDKAVVVMDSCYATVAQRLRAQETPFWKKMLYSGLVGLGSIEQNTSSYSTSLIPNAYGPEVHMNQYGQPVTLQPDFGGVPGELLQIKPNAYGPGVHMDQYGRPVREYPWP